MKASRDLRWSELKVGVLIIIALALLGFGIMQLGGAAGLFTSTYRFYLMLDNSLGLKAGSVVRLAGLDVGNVRDIGFSSNRQDKKIVISLDVKKEFVDRIRADSVVTIRTMGLLGDKYVDISVGSPDAPVVPPGGTLKDVKETQLTSVITGAASGLEGLNAVLAQLRKIMGDVTEGEGTAGLLLKDPKLYRQLADSAESLRRVSEDLRSGKGSAGKLIVEPDLYNNLLGVSEKANELVGRLNSGSLAMLSEDKAFYENLKDVSVNLKDVSASAKELMGKLSNGSIARLSDNQELYARVERMSGRLDALIERLDSGKGSAGKLLHDEKLYNNMNKFFEDADALVLDIKEHPKKYLKFSVF